jgi:hypothetical protein
MGKVDIYILENLTLANHVDLVGVWEHIYAVLMNNDSLPRGKQLMLFQS